MTDDTEGKLDGLLGEFDKEADQEAAIRANRDSFLTNLPPDDVMVSRSREFDDIEKHYVRRQFWVKTAQGLSKRKGDALSILTLPGKHAIEVKLYLAHNLVQLGNADGLYNVVAFENEPTILGHLKLECTNLKRIFRGCVLEALTNSRDENHAELVSLFPFDIINLDLTVNLVAPSEGPYGIVLESIAECLKLQSAQRSEWALFLTFRGSAERTNPHTITQLKQIFDLNIKSHDAVKQACVDQHGCETAEEVFARGKEAALAEFTAKWTVEQAQRFGWSLRNLKNVFYERSPEPYRYQIRKLIFTFEKKKTDPNNIPSNAAPRQPDEIAEIVRVIRESAGVNVDNVVAGLKRSKPTFESNFREQIAAFKRSSRPENPDATPP